MDLNTLILFAQRRGGEPMSFTFIATVAVLGFFAVVMLLLVLSYGNLWFQAYMSNARVSIFSLVGMSLRQVNARAIVQSKIMAMQAGVGDDPHTGITTRRLVAAVASWLRRNTTIRKCESSIHFASRTVPRA